MKQLCARLLVIAALGVLLAFTGCITNQNDLVVTDEICANITEHETTGSFSTFTVVDDFKDQLEKALAKAGKKSADVKSIHMIAATFAADPEHRAQPHPRGRCPTARWSIQRASAACSSIGWGGIAVCVRALL